MTLLYSALSPWLVSGLQAFGVMASLFVTPVWWRVVFLGMVYGAAMARYHDYVAGAAMLDEADRESYAASYALELEAQRARQDGEAAHELERRQHEAEATSTADATAPG